ncbi:MAG: terminase family protein [Polyangiaceae bacterium]|nr:terminase family protein [Polyangiaceae bacterium]
MTTNQELARKIARARRELWFRGDLRYLTKPGPQRWMYDWIKFERSQGTNYSPFVLNCHRRLGKTFLSTLFCCEECLSRPGVYAKLAAPTSNHAQDILDEHWGIILSECPPELEPAPFRNEKYTFRNPRWGDSPRAKSLLRLYGVQNDRGNKMRGGSTDVVVFDECREMPDLAYTWTSVLLPTFRGRKNPVAIMLSTPPESMDHPFVTRFINGAMESGRYRRVSGAEDPNWTDEEDEMFAQEMGGRDSIDYRREIGCELISDTRNLIIPEFAEADQYGQTGIENDYIVVPESIKRPEYYDVYTLADMGGAGKRTDHCGILFAHYDFQRHKIVVEQELFLRDLDTRSIVWTWRDTLASCYDKQREQTAGREIVNLEVRAEATAQQITDFRAIWNFPVAPVTPIDREVARRALRTAFRMGVIEVSAECRELIYQLRNGTRTQTGDFVRSERLGHCDLIAALSNLFRIVDTERNPFPPVWVSRDKVFVAPKPPAQGEAWNQFFKRGSNGRVRRS